MKTTISERFNALIKALGLNANSFAKHIGKAYTSIESICKGKTRPSYDLLESVFITYPELSRDWLVMGDGEMFHPKQDSTEKLEKSDSYLQDHLKTLEGNFDKLAAQLETKDQQIASLQESQKSLQKMLEMVLGKSKGANKRPLVSNMGSGLRFVAIR
ncbi:hypothetical protein [Spirosoma pomorum]